MPNSNQSKNSCERYSSFHDSIAFISLNSPCTAITESSPMAVSPTLLLPVSAPSPISGLSFPISSCLQMSSFSPPASLASLRHFPRCLCITYWSLNVTPRVATIPFRIRILETVTSQVTHPATPKAPA
ncbi:unnamed protein product [Gordionus sp. m RMFG-2023]